MAARTTGQALLQRALEAQRQTDFASAISRRTGRRVHQSVVSKWAKGVNTPSAPMMIAILAETGIPVEAWITPAAETKSAA